MNVYERPHSEGFRERLRNYSQTGLTYAKENPRIVAGVTLVGIAILSNCAYLFHVFRSIKYKEEISLQIGNTTLNCKTVAQICSDNFNGFTQNPVRNVTKTYFLEGFLDINNLPKKLSKCVRSKCEADLVLECCETFGQESKRLTKNILEITTQREKISESLDKEIAYELIFQKIGKTFSNITCSDLEKANVVLLSLKNESFDHRSLKISEEAEIIAETEKGWNETMTSIAYHYTLVVNRKVIRLVFDLKENENTDTVSIDCNKFKNC